MSAAVEVAPGVHAIEAPLGERRFRAFLLRGERMTVLVDTGVASTPEQTLLPALAALGAVPDMVVISHADYDHHGGNAAVAAAFPRARFACHPADRAQIEQPALLVAQRYGEFAPRYGLPRDPDGDAEILAATTAVPIDLELRGGERLRLGADWWVELLHSPGHSRGHLTLWDRRSRTALIADAALAETLRTTSGAPAFPPTYRYVDAYRATTRQLRELRAERLLTSHFAPIEGREAVDAFLDTTDQFTDRVERALLDVLAAAAAAPPSLADLIAALAPRLGGWTTEAAAYLAHPLAGHLEQLEQLGRVARIEPAAAGEPPRFALAR